MARIVEGLWDCPYCDQKGISGLKKHCPNCGHPQDEGTTFYMGTEKKYVAADKAKNYGKGADWTCSYCDSLNRYDATVCVNCGATREENKGDYFENEQKAKVAAQKKVQEKRAQEQAARQQAARAAAAKRRNIILGVILAVVALVVLLTRPRNTTAEVTDMSWSRTLAIEEEQWVQESDWNLPDGAELVSQSREIHHYDQVVDHYESVEVERSRQVQDGYDESTEYRNNGDGTFSEVTVQTPRYTTEYYTETVQEPVYVDVPVYQTKYVYNIWRWIEVRDVTTSGTDDTPYWGEYTLGEKEREGTRTEVYEATLAAKKKSYTVKLDESMWSSLKKGKKVKITVQVGDVTKIDGVAIK